MKYLAGLIVLAAIFQPYFVWGDAAAAAAAASSNGGGAAAAAAAAAADGGAAAAAAAASTAPPPPRATIPCACNKIYSPVCGSDGRTYSNECVLRCVSLANVKNGLPAITVKKRGECPRWTCRCITIYKPVCGTDGNSYSNECFLGCENARRKLIGLPPTKIAYPGLCRRNICTCSNVIIPVCGTDNKTYRNICYLQCASILNQQNNKPPIWWQYSGPCKKENCGCPPVNIPICGADGNTYKNRCELSCINRRRDQLGKPPIGVAYPGACIKNCACPPIYNPVCATDGTTSTTFLNICILRCTNKKRIAKGLKPLQIRHWGACGCKCPLVYNPVCALDDRTYPNPCTLRCENKRRSDLGLRLLYVLHKGRCTCYCGYCPLNYDPVCGNDGRTYWNRCWLICNRSCNSDIGHPLFAIHKGPC